MKGVFYVEWDESAQPPRPRYFGYGDIDGQRVHLHGDLDTSSDVRRVRFTLRSSVQPSKNVPRGANKPNDQESRT